MVEWNALISMLPNGWQFGRSFVLAIVFILQLWKLVLFGSCTLSHTDVQRVFCFRAFVCNTSDNCLICQSVKKVIIPIFVPYTAAVMQDIMEYKSCGKPLNFKNYFVYFWDSKKSSISILTGLIWRLRLIAKIRTRLKLKKYLKDAPVTIGIQRMCLWSGVL